MKYTELREFITKKMRMAPGYNYQPVMIRTLFQNDGKATREEIIEELKITNSNSSWEKPTNYPFKILEKQNVCKYNEFDKTYELLDFDSYSIAEKAWIIVECVLKDKTPKEILEKEIKNVRRRIENEPNLTKERDEVLDRYGKMFALDNIKNITEDDLKGFFRYENNHHWKGVNQPVGHLVKDMSHLQKSLKIIFDENKTISERIKQLRGDKNDSDFISWFGNAVYTPILLVGSNMQYAVINGIVDTALDNLRLFPKKFLPKKEEDEWRIIPLMQEIVSEVARRYDLDLWIIDWVWWDLSLREERRSYWLVTPGYQSNLKDEMISNNLISIGFADMNLLEYFEEKSNQEKSGMFKSTEKKEELKKLVMAQLKKEYQKKVLELRKKKNDKGKLSKNEEKELAKKEKTPHHSAVSFNWMPMRDFVKSKINDEVILWNGNNKIFATGRIIGGYQYLEHDIHDQHHHQKQVEWTDTEERDIPDTMIPGGQRPSFVETDKSATTLVDWLYGTGEKSDQEYFLLRHNVNGPWKDDLGKEYHFGKTVANQQKLRSAGAGTKTIWFTKSGGDYYFWGYGEVKEIQTEVEDEKWKLVYDDFKFFEDNLVNIQGRKLERGSESIKQQIMELPKFNINTSMFTIPKKVYEEIIGGRSHMSSSTISDIPDSVPYAQVLNFNKNLILYGPPGTGKTHKSEEAAKALTKNQGDGNFIRRVTFHPSYSYEDFVEGFRPNVEDDNSQSYVLDDGIFKKICDEAKNDSGNRYVLLIDEINRGNIPKIFGELITVIEDNKRGSGKPRALAYSKEKDNFYVPENLYIIGTMNTADKSLVQMDEALRRRFVFEELMPEPDLLEKKDRPGKKYKDILENINKKIIEGDKIKQFRDRQIGHSYFWKKPFGDKQMRLVIKYQIIPLLQDYFYDDYEEIKRILGKKIIGKDNRPGPILDEGNEKDLITELRRHLSGKSSAENENEEQN